MRAMKDSGIEWIGQIPQEWDTKRIKYLYNIISGNGFKEHLQGNSVGDYPFYKVSDINETGMNVTKAMNYVSNAVVHEYKFNIVPAGALIMAKIGEALKKNHRKITSVECLIDNNLQALVPIGDIDARYFFYQFLCIDMAWFDNGGTIPSVDNQSFLDFRVVTPSVDVQKAVADYLDLKCAEIDALIAAKEKTNALLKERRQSIIYESVTKGLNPDAPMKDSGVEWIGQIPEHWAVAALKRVATPSTGMTPSKVNPQYWEGDIPWFSSKDIKSDYLFDSEDHISQQAVEECGLTVHDENSVVFCARSGILRHTFPVSVLNCKGTINQDLRVLATSASIDPEFLMYYLRGMNNTIVTLYQKVGATVESIEMEWLLYLPVALPSIGEQKRIAEYVVACCNKIDRQIAANEVSVTKLREYRQSIIYEAVTGKIEV